MGNLVCLVRAAALRGLHGWHTRGYPPARANSDRHACSPIDLYAAALADGNADGDSNGDDPSTHSNATAYAYSYAHSDD